MISLCKLNPGEKAKVVCITDGPHKQRLCSLGIIEGTVIESLYKSPSGNPVAYLIRGTVFALRNETAEKIIIEELK